MFEVEFKDLNPRSAIVKVKTKGGLKGYKLRAFDLAAHSWIVDTFGDEEDFRAGLHRGDAGMIMKTLHELLENPADFPTYEDFRGCFKGHDFLITEGLNALSYTIGVSQPMIDEIVKRETDLKKWPTGTPLTARIKNAVLTFWKYMISWLPGIHTQSGVFTLSR